MPGESEGTDPRSALIGAGMAAAIAAIVLVGLATADVGSSTVRIVAAIVTGVVAARIVESYL
jgi:uncharacterized protein (DUF697 family)